MDESIDLKPKKLYKSETERIIFGIAGGIAEYYNIDPTWIRLVFVFLALSGGVGIIIYLILALVMPGRPMSERVANEKLKNDETKTLSEDKKVKKITVERRRNAIGFVVIIIGLLFLFKGTIAFYWVSWDILWPLIIILTGFSVISNSKPFEK